MEKRTSYVNLPSATELAEILEREAKRIISREKGNIHYPDFSSVCNLIEQADLSTDLFRKDYKLGDINQELINTANSLIGSLTEYILNNPNDQKAIGPVYDYLAEEDGLEKSDLIFVFGTKSNARIEKAVELFKLGYAPKLLVSGKSPIYKEEDVTEGEIYKRFAIEKGVPENAIIVEKQSISIPDNIKSSLNLMDKLGFSFNSVILVNSAFAQRRGWCHFKKFTPDTISIYRSNAISNEKLSRENWYKDQESIKVILNEFIKMKVGVILNTA